MTQSSNNFPYSYEDECISYKSLFPSFDKKDFNKLNEIYNKLDIDGEIKKLFSEYKINVKKSQLPINEECTFHPASPYAISKVGTDLIARHYGEAYNMCVMSTRMFTHTGPRRGDVFAESSFAKQIAMIENNLIPPVVKVGNLKSLRTIADVRDAVRAYYMLVTKNLGQVNFIISEEIIHVLLKKY